MAKRSLSDSDCDDLFSDTKDSCMTPPESDNCGGHGVTRKKRRGIIEKRRRDRINNSLSELRRLVPTAFEKQGSAKLEKAEILQMTVDHLKMLHTKGYDSLAYDPQKFAMDYQSIGFRECVSEVGRYLASGEGLDSQDVFRSRLMSHLQCFASQRELHNKQATASSWGLTPNFSYSLPHQTGGIPSSPFMQPAQHPTLIESPTNSHQSYGNSSNHTSPNMGDLAHQHMVHGNNVQRSFPSTPNHPHMIQQQHSINIHSNNNNLSPMGPYGGMPGHPQGNSPNLPYQRDGKPYRPWGTELAY